MTISSIIGHIYFFILRNLGGYKESRWLYFEESRWLYSRVATTQGNLIHKITLTRVNSRRFQTKLGAGILPSTCPSSYGSKNATTDVSEPISRFGYVRDSSYSAAKVAVWDSICWTGYQREHRRLQWMVKDECKRWSGKKKEARDGTFRPTSILSTVSVPSAERPT